jgi:hypothetical protein
MAKLIANQAPEKLTEIATDIIGNRVFTDRHCQTQNDLSMVFMPLALGAFKDATDEWMNDLGMLYEYMEKVGPRSCNGLPGFFSMRLLNKHDAEIVWAKVRAMQHAMKNAADSVTA